MPAYLYVVIPGPKRQGDVVVIDPQKNNEVVFEGKNYEETETWLLEDEFLLVKVESSLMMGVSRGFDVVSIA